MSGPKRELVSFSRGEVVRALRASHGNEVPAQARLELSPDGESLIVRWDETQAAKGEAAQ